MQGEREEVNQEGNNDKADNTGNNVGTKSRLSIISYRTNAEFEITYDGHLGVTKLAPKVLNGVETDKSSDKETNKLDTADTANAETSHEEPKEPLRVETVVALVVELRPAEDGGDSTAQQHGVEQDETADGGVGVFAENHQSYEPDSRTSKLELPSSEVGQGDAKNTESCVEDTHDGVVNFFGVLFAGLELEGTVVSSEDSRETNKHLAKRRVNIEVVLMLDIVRTELAEAKEELEKCWHRRSQRDVLSLVPSNNVADTNLV